MVSKRPTKTEILTMADVTLFGRIAYAMVVFGLWEKAVRRTEEAFDFFEIRGQNGDPTFRIGRLRDGQYVLFTLATGVRQYGPTFGGLLSNIAFVPKRMVR